ncbi:MAG TPA: hypothetical protein VIF57_25205 [Polyangia bacterium]
MWSWEAVLIDAAAGAVAGGLASLVTRRLRAPGRPRPTVIWMICFVAGVVVAQQVAGPLVAQRRLRHELRASSMNTYGNDESAALNTQVLMAVMTDPRFEKRIRELHARAKANPAAPLKGPGHTGVADLIGAGTARLDGADQAALFDVKVALADRSPALCAGFWTGNVSAASLSEAMRALDRARQRTWITLSARALTKELDAAGAPLPAPGPAGQDAMAELVQSLSPEQQAAFATAAQGAPTDEIACRAFRALATGLAKTTTDEKRAAILQLLNGAAAGAG